MGSGRAAQRLKDSTAAVADSSSRSVSSRRGRGSTFNDTSVIDAQNAE